MAPLTVGFMRAQCVARSCYILAKREELCLLCRIPEISGQQFGLPVPFDREHNTRLTRKAKPTSVAFANERAPLAAVDECPAAVRVSLNALVASNVVRTGVESGEVPDAAVLPGDAAAWIGSEAQVHTRGHRRGVQGPLKKILLLLTSNADELGFVSCA